MEKSRLYPVLQALLAAALFGLSAPLAKFLLGKIEPIPLSAFLYLGSGIGLLIFKSFQRLGGQKAKEAPIGKADIPWLLGAVFAGGVIAPILLMFSLNHTPASTASLLLNFESVATTLIAVWFFKEAIGKKVVWAIAVITLASILLSWNSSEAWGISLGALGVLGACIFWGIDNNCTRNISEKDPITIVIIKGICAGSFSLLLAVVLHNPFPGVFTILAGMVLGSLCYGLSIVLFIYAMRSLGAARTGALFASAPFIGAVISFIMFRETPGLMFLISLPLMVAGVWLLIEEEHEHEHTHDLLEHEHSHCHDEHHQHTHDSEAEEGENHTHWHVHELLTHFHPHTPDIHHRHVH